MRLMLRLLATAALFAAPALSGLQPARAEAVSLVAHQASYGLTLDTARSGDVTDLSGTMGYEVTDACDGWAVRQRLQMTVGSRDGQDVEMISDYLTWESKDGTKLRFQTKQTTDTAVTEQVQGEANLAAPGGEGEVRYTQPAGKTVKLPAGTLFPMAHTAAIIAAAAEGKKFLSLPLFDGTGSDGAQNTSVIIVNWSGPSASPYPELAELSSGRVRVAFFPRDKDATSPDYEVGMRYWSNGVADALNMDFSDFVVNGKLKSFKLTPGHC